METTKTLEIIAERVILRKGMSIFAFIMLYLLTIFITVFFAIYVNLIAIIIIGSLIIIGLTIWFYFFIKNVNRNNKSHKTIISFDGTNFIIHSPNNQNNTIIKKSDICDYNYKFKTAYMMSAPGYFMTSYTLNYGKFYITYKINEGEGIKLVLKNVMNPDEVFNKFNKIFRNN